MGRRSKPTPPSADFESAFPRSSGQGLNERARRPIAATEAGNPPGQRRDIAGQGIRALAQTQTTHLHLVEDSVTTWGRSLT